MDFKQFQDQVSKVVLGEHVKCSQICHGKVISEMVDGRILVDRAETEFVSLEEARDSIKQQVLREELEQEIQLERYSEISNNKIVDIIKQHHGNVRVTDTLVESYVELASSKIFTADPVALSIRNLNKLDRLIESRIDFQLDDGSIMVIAEDTQVAINNAFAQHSDVIDFMKTSKENFLSVLKELI